MRRFMIVGLKVAVILSLIVGGGVFVARRQLLPDYLSGLHLTDCEIPCWMGIIPGKTTLSEAQQIIMTAFADSRIYKASINPTDTPMTLAISLENRPDPPNVFGINVWVEA